MTRKRVVVTGMGVVAPNGVGLGAYREALRAGRSGITWHEELAKLNYACQIGGSPPLTEEEILELEREAFVSLCGEPKSQERMQHMLQKNKPLRN